MEWLCLERTSGHHLVQPSCSKQDQLDQVGQSQVQMSFEFLWGQRLHSHAGQLVPVLDHPNKKKGVFFCLSRISCISKCALTEHFLELATPLITSPSSIYIYWKDPTRAYTSPNSTVPALSLSLIIPCILCSSICSKFCWVCFKTEAF